MIKKIFLGFLAFLMVLSFVIVGGMFRESEAKGQNIQTKRPVAARAVMDQIRSKFCAQAYASYQDAAQNFRETNAPCLRLDQIRDRIDELYGADSEMSSIQSGAPGSDCRNYIQSERYRIQDERRQLQDEYSINRAQCRRYDVSRVREEMNDSLSAACSVCNNILPGKGSWNACSYVTPSLYESDTDKDFK
jgi:hypothetical protein